MMPVHDWTRVSDGIFHDFHYSWVLEIKRALGRGLLPSGHYVMAEQIGGDLGAPDALTLQATGNPPDSGEPLVGTSTLTQSPPAVRQRATITRDSYSRMQRTVVVRHISDDRIVAMIEILSAGNTSSKHAIRSLVNKAVAAFDSGIHLLLVDVHTPGSRDPNGIHQVLLGEISSNDYTLPGEHLLTAVSYVGGVVVEAFVEHFAVGEAIPRMPLFLTRENYIQVPLDETYLAAWADVPPRYQGVLTAIA